MEIQTPTANLTVVGVAANLTAAAGLRGGDLPPADPQAQGPAEHPGQGLPRAAEHLPLPGAAAPPADYWHRALEPEELVHGHRRHRRDDRRAAWGLERHL